MIRKPILLTALAVALTAVAAAAAVDPINTSGRERLAVDGYDVLAYFDGEARLGVAEYEHRWMNATWYFASAENRDRFAADPERFAPQYGGYCAYAVSRGSTADVDPEAWTVHDDKLYLNYSKSVRTKWRKDIPGNVAKADRNWPKLLAD